MKRWKIKEKGVLSLSDLNKYIADNCIQPSDLIEYRTVFDQMKQCTKYMITYWAAIDE